MAGPRRAASKDEGAVTGARMLVVEARYYEGIADELLAGARRALDAAQANYDVVTVPGAREIRQALGPARARPGRTRGRRRRRPGSPWCGSSARWASRRRRRGAAVERAAAESQ